MAQLNQQPIHKPDPKKVAPVKEVITKKDDNIRSSQNKQPTQQETTNSLISQAQKSPRLAQASTESKASAKKPAENPTVVPQ